MDTHYTPLNIEKLKKQYFTKKSNKLDMILIVLGLLTIVVQAILLFVLIQKKAKTPEPTVSQQQSPAPTQAPTAEPPSPTPATTSATLKSATGSAKVTTTVVPTAIR